MHNFKVCKVCGAPVRGNRYYCGSVECRRKADAARKRQDRANPKARKSHDASVEAPTAPAGPVDDRDELQRLLNERPDDDQPRHYDHAAIEPDAVGTHGYLLRDVYAYMVERSNWTPGPTPPPSPWYLPSVYRNDFEAWRASQ